MAIRGRRFVTLQLMNY